MNKKKKICIWKKKANLKTKNRTLYQNDYCKKAIWQQFLFDVIFINLI